MEIVKINGLDFQYTNETGETGGAEPALRGVSLDVRAGELVVICGRSGSGKTTLLRHLKPQLAPRGERHGEIFFNGRPLRSLDERSAAAKIGFVAQSPEEQLVTDKVWHELAFGLESLGVPSAEIRRRVAETASYFGIQNLFREDTASLSGGQKQILNLAAVMIMQPELLLLDEPTSRLDPIAAAEFLAMLQKINTELGTTIILTEHRLEEALPLASRVVVMERGAIACAGGAADVARHLRLSGSGLFQAMPAAARIWGALGASGEPPVSVNEGRAFLRSFLEKRESAESGGNRGVIGNSGELGAADLISRDLGENKGKRGAANSTKTPADLTSASFVQVGETRGVIEDFGKKRGEIGEANSSPKTAPDLAGSDAANSAKTHADLASGSFVQVDETRGVIANSGGDSGEDGAAEQLSGAGNSATPPADLALGSFGEVGETRGVIEDFDKKRGKIGAADSSQKTPELGAVAVELRCAWFCYERGSTDVLRGCDFRARFGEIVCVVGGNGAGKSTLLRLLAGAKTPRRGTVKRNGRACLLPQEPRLLFSKKTLAEELSGDAETVQKVALQCGISELLDRHPYDLSGGETARAALAKLLISKPEILLLDEPTSGLDAEAKSSLAELLRGISRDGACVVIVSHDIEFCAELNTRAALFFDGAIASEGSPREFFSGNAFYTTAAHRVSRGFVEGAVTVEDVVEGILGSSPSSTSNRGENSAAAGDRSLSCENHGEAETPRPASSVNSTSTHAENSVPGETLPKAAGEEIPGAPRSSITENNAPPSGLASPNSPSSTSSRAEPPAPGETLPKAEAGSASTPARYNKKIPLWRKICSLGIVCLCAAAWWIWGRELDFSALLGAGGVTAAGWHVLAAFGAGILALVGAALLIRGGKPLGKARKSPSSRKDALKSVLVLLVLLAAAAATVWLGVTVFPSYYLTATAIIIECLAAFFVSVERRSSARRLAVIAVLCALGVAGRAAFFWLPQVKPVLAIAILAGAGLGGEAGFTVGAVTMLVSNMMFGQGTWTPWQMFAAGTCGLLGGLFYKLEFLRRRVFLAVFGAAAAVIVYGGIVNPSAALIWARGALSIQIIATYWLTGLPFDAVNAFGTAAFLLVLSEPVLGAIARTIPEQKAAERD